MLTRLPLDVLTLITSFLNKTRIDWKTCKRREASLIRNLEWILVRMDWTEEMAEWTLFGRWYIDRLFTGYHKWDVIFYAPTSRPPDGVHYKIWYALLYRYLTPKKEVLIPIQSSSYLQDILLSTLHLSLHPAY